MGILNKNRSCEEEKTPRLLLHALLGEPLVSARVRIGEPNALAATLPNIEHIEETGAAHLSLGQDFDQKIFFLQRMRFQSAADVAEKTRRITERGYLLMGEIDDNPILWRESYEFTGYAEFAGCHALQTSTEPLAEILRQYNPHVLVFRNELRILPKKRDYSTENGPVTLFFGALNRGADWREIMPALNEVLRTQGDKVRVRVLYDRPFFDALETPHKELLGTEFPHGYAPYEVYTDALHRSDIALLPLRDTEFNRTKSDLKFIESAGNGAVALASPTVYAKTLRDGETGFLYTDARSFRQRLEILIEKPSLRHRVAESAYKYVQENRLLSRYCRARVAAWRELLARLPALERERMTRIETILNNDLNNR